jgi:hypothetical protein
MAMNVNQVLMWAEKGVNNLTGGNSNTQEAPQEISIDIEDKPPVLEKVGEVLTNPIVQGTVLVGNTIMNLRNAGEIAKTKEELGVVKDDVEMLKRIVLRDSSSNSGSVSPLEASPSDAQSIKAVESIKYLPPASEIDKKILKSLYTQLRITEPLRNPLNIRKHQDRVSTSDRESIGNLKAISSDEAINRLAHGKKIGIVPVRDDVKLLQDGTREIDYGVYHYCSTVISSFDELREMCVVDGIDLDFDLKPFVKLAPDTEYAAKILRSFNELCEDRIYSSSVYGAIKDLRAGQTINADGQKFNSLEQLFEHGHIIGIQR